MQAQRLYELNRTSTQFPEQLKELLYDKEWEEQLGLLPEDELVGLTGYLDEVWLILTPTTSRSSLSQVLDSLNPQGSPFRKCLHVLQKLCTSGAILPLTYEVSGELSITITGPVAFGGFCDAYKGTLGGADVCIKRLRIFTRGDQMAYKRVRRLTSSAESSDPDKLWRHSAGRLWSGNILIIRILCPSRESRSNPSNSCQNG